MALSAEIRRPWKMAVEFIGQIAAVAVVAGNTVLTPQAISGSVLKLNQGRFGRFGHLESMLVSVR